MAANEQYGASGTMRGRFVSMSKQTGKNGQPFVVLGKIDIAPGQHMVVNIGGLPQQVAWLRTVPYLVGFGVLGLHDGFLNDLGLSVTQGTDQREAYAAAVDALIRKSR